MSVKSKNWPKVYVGSLKSPKEKNDCVVRAITETFNIPYDDAHTIVGEKFGRKNRQGTVAPIEKFNKLYQEDFKIGNFKINTLPQTELTYIGTKNRIGLFTNEPKNTHQITVGMFIRKNPIGRYLVLVNGHAFSIVNGVIIGNKKDSLKLNARIFDVISAEE